jgi:hypothetical protein
VDANLSPDIIWLILEKMDATGVSELSNFLALSSPFPWRRATKERIFLNLLQLVENHRALEVLAFHLPGLHLAATTVFS